MVSFKKNNKIKTLFENKKIKNKDKVYIFKNNTNSNQPFKIYKINR